MAEKPQPAAPARGWSAAVQTGLAYLTSNRVGGVGVVLVTTAGVLWLLLIPSYWRGEAANPYLGILMFLALPGLFFVGLALIPVGILAESRRQRRTGEASPILSQRDALRRLGLFVGVTTLANLLIGSQFAYRAVTYMDTDSFCGQTCHTVMQPEYMAYKAAAHARVECVECHIGSGASWFLRSKLSGVGQLFAVIFNTYPRPIPSPVENLRPARETCAHCHWPQRFSGDRLLVHQTFSPDEENTALTTVAVLKIGGRTRQGAVGIHGFHLDPDTRIEYVAGDEHRQVIPQVSYTGVDGKTRVYTAADAKIPPQQLRSAPRRTMDCMDCHNRPAHVFQLPEGAVDEAMTQGSISSRLPFVKREAVSVLRREYPDQEAGLREIANHLDQFYRTSYPQAYAGQQAMVKNAVSAVQAIYERNVFPAMKVTWGSYPNNAGHTDWPGCFRCHDGSHASEDGQTISNDCSACHDVLAVEEKNPKILADLNWHVAPAESTATGK